MDKKLLNQQLDFSIDNKIVSMDRSDGHRLKIVTQFLRFVTSSVHALGLTGKQVWTCHVPSSSYGYIFNILVEIRMGRNSSPSYSRY